MKNLSRFELATIKRVAQNVKGFRTRRAKLQEKVDIMSKEIEELDKLIDLNEAPVVSLTNGFTSDQVLNGEMEKELAESPIIPEEGENTASVTSASITLDEEELTNESVEAAKLESLSNELKAEDEASLQGNDDDWMREADGIENKE